MKWKLLLIAATLLVLGSCTVAEKDGSEIGSGNNAFDTDDEDLFVGREGSTPDDDDDSDVDEISGSGTDSAEVTTLPETTRSLTACEQLKQSTKVDGYSSYVPKCTDNGEFERLQCRGTPLKGKCWCVGPEGTEIPGTLMDRPMTPDCVSGSNLKPCSYKYLKTNYKILGSNRPRCTFNGDYEAIQCYEAECWCVDQNGVEMVNTRSRGRSPVCEEKTEVPAIIPEVTKPSTATPSKEPKTPVTKPEYEIDPTDNGEVIIDDAFTPIPEVDESEKPKPVDETIGPILTVEDDDGEKEEKDQNRDNSYSKQGPLATSTLNAFVNKPFILGAIIAGAVVGLLGAILLVMFIVYRMRKKDEGSYALEEQKFTNYSYMKAPDKEFYA